MKYNPDKHHRRSIRLKGYDYSQPGAYYITVVTHGRECLFGEIVDGNMILNDAGKFARKCWVEIPKHFPHTDLDEFIIMPNHVHGIIVIVENDKNVGAIHVLPLRESPMQRRKMILPKIIGRFKMNTAKHINKMRNSPGVRVWQRNYWEHVIRNENELNRIREYIINNPLQWEMDKENSASFVNTKVEYGNWQQHGEINFNQ